MPSKLIATTIALFTSLVALTWLAWAGAAPAEVTTKLPAPATDLPQHEGQTSRTAVFAGGCFWCVEAVFEPLVGVTDVVSGYAGGTAETADYDKVSNGETDHAEVVQITYTPSKIGFAKLLQVFFTTHDPLTGNGQHPDYGKQYRPAIFFASEDEKRVAGAYIEQLNSAGVFDKPIATGLEPLTKFYPAEEYHQDYVKNNPQHPYVLRWAVPKVEKVRKVFPELLSGGPATKPAGAAVGKVEKTDAEWRAQLSPEQFRVLREEGTERAGTSALNKEKRAGTYHCAACDLPVYDAVAKFESGTGWPSFFQPIAAANVTEKPDTSHGMTRVEIECARCGGHLGHVFNDGPEPTGLRYCMNGAALTFKPAN